MLSNQSSKISDKNNVTSITAQKIRHMKNRLDSDQFKKLILHRRVVAKKNSVIENKKKYLGNNAVANDKLLNTESFVQQNCVTDSARNSDSIITNKATLSIENLVEQNMGVLCQSRSLDYADELNRLIKKITLSFTVEKSESQFVIKDGIFNGGKFNIVKNNKQLILSISDINTVAEKVLRQHQNILKYRLLRREINLQSMTFI